MPLGTSNSVVWVIYLANFVEQNLAVKARSCKLGIGQRAAAHCSSQTDNDEAFMAGQAAVKAAMAGETDKMVILVRGEGEHIPVKPDWLLFLKSPMG
jgi:6-phosphofructokinase